MGLWVLKLLQKVFPNKIKCDKMIRKQLNKNILLQSQMFWVFLIVSILEVTFRGLNKFKIQTLVSVQIRCLEVEI